MPKFSAKWKWFLALNYLFGALVILFLVQYIGDYSNSVTNKEEKVFWIVFLFQIVATLLGFILNIYIVHTYFPDKSLPFRVRQTLYVSVCVDVTVILLTILLIIVGFSNDFYREENDEFGTDDVTIALVFLFLFIFFMTYLIVRRLQINGYLKKMNSMNNLLDQIGKE